MAVCREVVQGEGLEHAQRLYSRCYMSAAMHPHRWPHLNHSTSSGYPFKLRFKHSLHLVQAKVLYG